MRTSGAAALVLVATIGVARGQEEDNRKAAREKDKTPAAPLNLLGAAARGDWLMVHVVSSGEGKKEEYDSVYVVKDVDGDDVLVKEGPSFQKTLHSKEKGPTLGAILGIRQATFSFVKVTDEKKTVVGKEFETKSVSFEVKENETVWKGRAWFHRDVKVLGLVAAKLESEAGSLELELEGYGTEEKTLFGKSLEELDRELVKKKKERQKEHDLELEKEREALEKTLSRKLTAAAKGMMLYEALKELGVENWSFEQGVDSRVRVTFEAKDEAASSVLKRILDGLGYSYELEGSVVSIRKKKE